jgi:DNA-binding MarR family transcriptional regulator
MILYNIGKSQLTVGEISNRGYYLGSNVSYNLKKMIDNGYLLQEQSLHDRRSSQVRLTSKGMKVLDKLDTTLQKQVESLIFNGLKDSEIQMMLSKGRILESFWSNMLVNHFR